MEIIDDQEDAVAVLSELRAHSVDNGLLVEFGCRCRPSAFAGRAGAATPTTTSTLAQTFIAPYGSTQLGIWYQQSCPDTVAHAWTTITVRDITAAVTRTALPKTCTNSGQWVQVTAAVQPGHKYRLTLLNRDDNDLGDGAYTAFDDITTA